jgi:hypothetical protein
LEEERFNLAIDGEGPHLDESYASFLTEVSERIVQSKYFYPLKFEVDKLYCLMMSF